jgi:PST family polysaccharide transporter
MALSAQSAQPHSQPSAVRTSTLAEGVLILLGLTVVQRLVGFVRSILFCRWLDADQLGQWDLAFNFLMLAAPLAVFGLPGSFGRYVEAYRESGRLRAFLRRTTWASFVPAITFCVVAAAVSPWLAELIFGGREQATLVLVMAGTLAALITFNFLTCLFTALRAGRIISYMQFSNTVLFAVVSLVLMTCWQATAVAGVAAFGVACFLSAAASIVWMVRLWRELPAAEARLGHGELWAKLLPFAFWVWVTNWVSNSFDLADRYMIVHYGGLDPRAALDLVGQYHSARVMPVLFLGLADMLSTWITPHLIGDWEAGRREAVGARLIFILKVFLLAFLGISIGMLVCEPLFFHTALADKFGFGQAIFPWTLACALWTGLAMISNNWLWCAERSRLATVGLAVGLVTNVGLNLWLLPRYGLNGVVVASAAAKFLSLMLLWTMCWLLELKVDRRLLLVSLLPALLLFGPWWALLGAAIVASGILPAVSLFDAAERATLAGVWDKIADRFKVAIAKRRLGERPA